MMAASYAASRKADRYQITLLPAPGTHGRIDRRPRARLLTVAVLAIAGLLPTSPSEASQEPADGRVGDIDCDPTPTELEDIETMAEQQGMPHDEAVERYGWQSCFTDVTNRLREAYPERFAGAAITEGGQAAWVAFKDDVPDDAVELTDAIPVPVELRHGQGFSEAELDQTLQATYRDIHDDDDVVDAAGGYDLETGVIAIRVQPRAALTGQGEREHLEEELQPDQPANASITVDVRVVADLQQGPEDAAAQIRAGWKPAGYTALVTAALVIVLIAGLLARRRRASR